MKKLFVLEASSGSWDDSATFILGVYSTRDSAEKNGEKFLERRNEILEDYKKTCPVSEDLLNEIEDLGIDPEEKVSPSQADAYYKWWYAQNRVQNINEYYHIYEYELDKEFIFDDFLNQEFMPE